MLRSTTQAIAPSTLGLALTLAAGVARAEPASTTTAASTTATTTSPTPPSPTTASTTSGPATAAPPPAPPPAPEVSPLVPRGEAEAMAVHPVAGGFATFKPGGGLEIRSADGRFSLRVSAWAQLRLTVDAAPSPAMTLEFNRARLIFTGNVFSKHIHYMAHLMFAPRDLGFVDGVATRPPIFLWYTTYTRFQNAHLQAGFFFVPHARQRMSPAPLWQFPDNSSASYEFTLNQDLGVQVSSPDLGGLGVLRYYAGAFIGDGYDWYRARDFGLTYLGRLEVLPLGDFDDYSDADFVRSLRPKLSLGVAYAFSDRDPRSRQIAGAVFADGGTMSAHNFTADLVFKWAGVSLFADFYLRQGWRQPGGAVDMDGAPIAVIPARSGVGWTAQIGYLFPHTRVELVGRYSGMRPPTRRESSLLRVDAATAGLNYYFFRHALKVQLDYTRSWGPGLAAGRGDQLRLQLQTAF